MNTAINEANLGTLTDPSPLEKFNAVIQANSEMLGLPEETNVPHSHVGHLAKIAMSRLNTGWESGVKLLSGAGTGTIDAPYVNHLKHVAYVRESVFAAAARALEIDEEAVQQGLAELRLEGLEALQPWIDTEQSQAITTSGWPQPEEPPIWTMTQVS